MNQSIFNTTGGYPLNAERLQELQTTMNIFNAFGFIAGNYTILSGCAPAGSSVTSGVVFVNGEVLEFRGGIALATVVIVEETVSKPFKNGQPKAVYKTRYVKFGSGTGAMLWINFKTLTPLKDIPAKLAEKASTATVTTLTTEINKLKKITAVFVANGGIVPWGKTAETIPQGWSPYSPAKGRMLFGRDAGVPEFDTVGESGGSRTKTLTVAQMPPHTHDYKLNTNSAGDGIPAMERGNSVQNQTYTTESRGGGQPFDIMPPYVIVEYIHYTG